MVKISTRKPHSHLAGYVFERKHPLGHIVCYKAKEATIGHSGYIVVIERVDKDGWASGLIGPSFSSLPKARAFVKDELAGVSGYDWGVK